MNLNHIHLGVRDLRTALDWLDRVWQLKPQFQNDRMATIHFGSFIYDIGCCRGRQFRHDRLRE
jgi:hypothetical protein